ncbi:hypothetical protein V1477_004274 [Vespula maculifrons]|uniref:Uncharacterized protein n=1 Tax=Vespula maculifrons TaxID=7453 RepID=A0ABD2CR45_VESMC
MDLDSTGSCTFIAWKRARADIAVPANRIIGIGELSKIALLVLLAGVDGGGGGGDGSGSDDESGRNDGRGVSTDGSTIDLYLLFIPSPIS